MKMNLKNLQVQSFVTAVENKVLMGGAQTNNKRCYDASAIDACPTLRGCQ